MRKKDIFDLPVVRIRTARIRRADIPKEGIFFVVPYDFNEPPVLEYFLGDKVAHKYEWMDIVDKFVSKHPCLKGYYSDLMKSGHTMFPRGRVGYDANKDQWYVWIGSKQQYTHALKDSIVNAFGLNAITTAGKLFWIPDDHETRDPGHIEIMNRIIEKIKECEGKNVIAGLNKFFVKHPTKEQMHGVDDSKMDIMNLLKRG